MKKNYRMVSWWLRKDDLPWPNQKTMDKFRRRAELMAREGADSAIIFGAHFRWDFMPVISQLHDLIAFTAQELHQYGIILFDHHSSVLTCNYNRDAARFDRKKTFSNHRQMLISPPDGFLPDRTLDDWKMKNRDGSCLFYPQYAAQSFCMSNPEFREAYYDYVRQLLKDTGIDGLMSDDAIFPIAGCFCPHCLRSLKDQYGLDLPPAEDHTFWRNRDNPDYRKLMRMRLDTVREYFRGITECLPAGFPVMSCCASSIHPAILERGLTYLEFVSAGANTVMLEMCGNTPDAGGTLFKKELASQMHHLAVSRKFNLPCIGLGYGFSPDAAFMIWAFNKFLNSGTWYSSLIHRLGLNQEDFLSFPEDAAQLNGIFNYEKTWQDWFDCSSNADIAILFSNDTTVNYGGAPDDYMSDYEAACRYCLENGCNADVVFDIPDPDSQWKLLLLPSAVCLSARQEEALEKWTAAGREVLAVGPLGFRTEDGSPASPGFARKHHLEISFPETGRGSLLDEENAAAPAQECRPESVLRPLPGFLWDTGRFSRGLQPEASEALLRYRSPWATEGWAVRSYKDAENRLLVHFIALNYAIGLNQALEARRDPSTPAYEYLKIIDRICPENTRPVSLSMPEQYRTAELLEPCRQSSPRILRTEELQQIPVAGNCPYFILRFSQTEQN